MPSLSPSFLRSLILGGIFGLLSASDAIGAAPRAADELLSALQTCLLTNGDVAPLVAGLDELPSSDLSAIGTGVERAWSRQLESYYEAFAASAGEQHRREARSDQQRTVRRLREEFHAVRQQGEGDMKKLLETTSWPAMQTLRELLMPTAAGVLQKAPPALRTQRQRLLLLATFRNGLLKASVSVIPPMEEEEFAAAEQALVDKHSGLDRDGLRLLEKNAALAAKEELPLPEVRGLRELNEMRLLVGLEALALDPLLCEAARGHSRDMAEHQFFSHTSPLPGKETPSKRAAEAGTSGGGENIYMGSANPRAANKGWFFSPGHHKNMFNPSYRRVGLGLHGTHWTQMFGR